jgi:energy-converting hydrogenase Eha subunit B
MTYDGTNMRGYLNGALVSGPTAASGTGGSAFGSSVTYIGAGHDGGNTAASFLHFTSGIIDDAAIFSRALSAAEIATWYTNIKSVNGLAKASVKTINGIAIASVKSFNGIT